MQGGPLALLALLALPACLAGGAPFVGGLLPSTVGLAERSLLLRASDGTECAAFDLAAGLVATAAHCATGEYFTLSDGRTATLLRRGAIAGLSDEVTITDLDVAILLPSVSGPTARLYRGILPPGTPIEVRPPGESPVLCQLTERRSAALLMSSCSIRDGWSGSPVYARINGQHRLVGLMSGYDRSSRVAWAVHVSAVEAMLQ